MSAKHRGKTSLAVLAELVGGSVSGDPSTSISGVAPLDVADTAQLSFLTNPKYQDKVANSHAAAIISHPQMEGSIDKPLLLVDNPYLAFAKILTYFEVDGFNGTGVMPGAHIHPDAEISDNVTISQGCVVCAGASVGCGTYLAPNVVLCEDVIVGEDCVIYPNVTIREKCVLGNRVILQPGAVVGSDGFGFAADGNEYYKIPQVGHVAIEDDVEIGACTCIDRGTMGVTRIRRGTKIDNLVQIAHNVDVGEDTAIAAQFGVAGSATIGDHCTFGGQSGVSGHIKVGNNVTLAGRGGISNNIDDNQSLAGFPSMPHRDWLKMSMSLTHVAAMRRELKEMKKEIEELHRKLSEDDIKKWN